MTGWATTGPCGRRMAASWHLAGRRSPGIPASVTLAGARTTPMISAYRLLGVYVANADGSAHNLLALGGNPDWFVSVAGTAARPPSRINAADRFATSMAQALRIPMARLRAMRGNLAMGPADPDRRPITCTQSEIGTSSR